MNDRIPHDGHEDHCPLPGSDRRPAPNLGRRPKPLAADETVHVTVILRRNEQIPDGAFDSRVPRDEIAARYGASKDDIDTVTATITDLRLSVDEVDQAGRRVRVSGTAAAMSEAFGTRLERVRSRAPDGRQVDHRHRTGELAIPAKLEGIVTAVLGLDDRPQSRAHFRIAPATAVATSYTPLDLGRVYTFPEGTDGTGQTIAIIELGGGFVHADLDAYFSGLGIATPDITAIGVDGADNTPEGDPNGADGEVLLDIEVSGALAPAAGIRVWFAPNTDAGFVDAVTTAAHATPTPTAISISWGQSEDEWTAQARTALDEALADAALLGVTVTAAAGDGGSTDRGTDGAAHVDFPASSPHVLACGGTSLRADASSGDVSAETVWNDGPNQGATGGGVSTAFHRPSWQQAAGVPFPDGKSGRGVPDVAADADPQTGYRVRVDGTELVIGGTSAVAPLWAALIARLAQSLGHSFGLVQPALYDAITSGAVACGFRDIVVGDNGAYNAVPGWDPCTGLGVPDGTALHDCLKTRTP